MSSKDGKPSGFTDPRQVIIERGGYRPATSGPIRPPHKIEDGYRPTTSGPTKPPTPPPPSTGSKK